MAKEATTSYKLPHNKIPSVSSFNQTFNRLSLVVCFSNSVYFDSQ